MLTQDRAEELDALRESVKESLDRVRQELRSIPQSLNSGNDS